MEYLPIILILTFFASIILTLLSLITKRTSMEIVNNMGIGWNIGNAFEDYYNLEEIRQDEQTILLNNIMISENMIKTIKKQDLKRFVFQLLGCIIWIIMGMLILNGCL
jgi:hypothetical protein